VISPSIQTLIVVSVFVAIHTTIEQLPL